ncbi:MAG: adenylate/guanylate cyclase domain-containing protein [Vicinamibacteria bacterium]|jgi:adenylate cyclase
MTDARRHPLAWLIPDDDEPGADLARRTQLRISVSVLGANLLGAAIVFAIGVWVLPNTTPGVDDESEARIVNLIAVVGFFALVTPFAITIGRNRLRRASDWLLEDRQPTADERRAALRAPRRIVLITSIIWLLATVVFGLLNATYSLESGQRVAISVLLGGMTTCALVYLLAERQLRPVAARALAAGVGGDRLGPGVKTRAFLTWALGTGVPIVGLGMIALSTLVEEDFTRVQLATAVLALCAIAIVVGLYSLLLSARAVADPLIALRQAVDQVDEGDLDAEVTVYDGSEVGQLQAGFNEMVSGLRERERLRDLFGRHVGEDVARAALEGDVELGGELREVAVLFTDVVGSTELASKRPPEEVVELLNQFFGIVVETVHRHGGWVNKFEGDAALAVFGAPVELDDAASAALATARELAVRLPREVDGLAAAIGVSAGEVVAGNVGAQSRFEYTVIGDPVNEAARLTELAKEKPERLLASAAILERASGEEAGRWRLDGAVTLRGRSAETRLALPVAE